jgi:aspartyl protease family protein
MGGEITPAGWVYIVLIGLLLLSLIGGARTGSALKTLRNALLWVAIFGGVLIVAMYREDIGMRLRAELDPAGAQVSAATNEVRIRGHSDGHFWVRAAVNGVPTLFLIDTGASDIVLSQDSARAAGIDLDGLRFSGEALTANGVVASAVVTLDSVAIGPIERRAFQGVVTAGRLEVNLLGMRYLRSLKSWRVEDNTLILVG